MIPPARPSPGDRPVPVSPAGDGPRLFAPGVPQAARRYDYWLGGKDNLAADRRSADAIEDAFPAIRTAARENRAFVRRAVHLLAADLGVRQFLDVGCGLPATPDVHEVAQAVHPAARVVYVDHDPVVATHARARLAGIRPGVREFVPGDLRRPDAIVDHPVVRRTLRPGDPVGLLLCAVLPFVAVDDEAYAAVRRLLTRLPAGSWVVLSHATYDPLPDAVAARLAVMGASDGPHGPFRARTRAEVGRFLDDLELVPPGLVSIVDWHPTGPGAGPADAAAYGALARIPGRISPPPGRPQPA